MLGSPRSRTLRFSIAAGALVLSIYMTWAAWRGPPPRSFDPTPPAVIRKATSSERAAVFQLAEAMTQQIRENKTPSSAMSLERLLAGPIPDNPLIEGVGTSRNTCDDHTDAAVDWLVCPTTMTVTAVMPR